jgi:hypothetical protein
MRKTLSIASGVVMLASILVPPGAAAQETRTAETKTSKERLSRKANDEQRVDNCRVPVELRGPTPRPGCGGETETSSAERGIAAQSR